MKKILLGWVYKHKRFHGYERIAIANIGKDQIAYLERRSEEEFFSFNPYKNIVSVKAFMDTHEQAYYQLSEENLSVAQVMVGESIIKWVKLCQESILKAKI